MTTIDPTAVEKLFLHCLFKEGEDFSTHVPAYGVIHPVGFHPGRIAESRAQIVAWLSLLPDAFRDGGMSFLGACLDRHGNQWTDLHQRMEQLFQLGQAIDAVECPFPREMWRLLPGGVPVFIVRFTAQDEESQPDPPPPPPPGDPLTRSVSSSDTGHTLNLEETPSGRVYSYRGYRVEISNYEVCSMGRYCDYVLPRATLDPMSREVRRVRADWDHPKDNNGHYKPLYGDLHLAAYTRWEIGRRHWAKGEYNDACTGKWVLESLTSKYTYTDWTGAAPQPDDYMPPEAFGDWYMMYETTSEGTPISPSFSTARALATWLVENKASAFGGLQGTFEGWLRVALGGYAPSLVSDGCQLVAGVAAVQLKGY